jgi:RNA polymerase sigma factor (sigma-70 family)
MTLAVWLLASDLGGDDTRGSTRDRPTDSQEGDTPVDPRALAIRDGDMAVFEIVYKGYFTLLCDFAVRYLRSMADAEELAQDVFRRLWERRVTLTGRERFPAYLLGAVRHRAIDALRHQRVMRAHDHAQGEHPPAFGAIPPVPDHDVSEALLADAVDRVLAALPEVGRQVLLLRWKHQLSYAEIGEALGISEGAARVQASRAFKVVKPYLQPLLDQLV